MRSTENEQKQAIFNKNQRYLKHVNKNERYSDLHIFEIFWKFWKYLTKLNEI